MAALGASEEQAPGVDFGTVEWVMSAIMARGLNETAARRVPRPHPLLGSHTAAGRAGHHHVRVFLPGAPCQSHET